MLPKVKNSSSFSIPNIFSNTCHNAAKLEKRKVKVPGHNYFWVVVYPFFKECCFTVRVRVRVSVNPNPNLACEQALRGALAAGREKEGELATTSLDFDPNSISNSSVARRRLSCQISANKREAETSANVKIH